MNDELDLNSGFNLTEQDIKILVNSTTGDIGIYEEMKDYAHLLMTYSWQKKPKKLNRNVVGIGEPFKEHSSGGAQSALVIDSAIP